MATYQVTGSYATFKDYGTGVGTPVEMIAFVTAPTGVFCEYAVPLETFQLAGGNAGEQPDIQALTDAIEDLVADPDDLRFAVPHAPRRETAVDQTPPLVVERIVHRDHHRERIAVRPRAPPAGERHGILLDGEHVGVAGDGPHLVPLVVVDGRVRAHPRPRLVRLLPVPPAVEQVDVVTDRVRRHSPA